MYKDIGNKIKTLAVGTFILEAAASVVTGIILAIEVDELYLLIAFIGPFLAWLASWLMYGFGQLIENSDIAVAIMQEQNTPKTNSSKTPKMKNTNKQKTTVKNEPKVKVAVAAEAVELEIEYIDVECPNCGEQLSFEKGEKQAVCPECDTKFDIA